MASIAWCLHVFTCSPRLATYCTNVNGTPPSSTRIRQHQALFKMFSHQELCFMVHAKDNMKYHNTHRDQDHETVAAAGLVENIRRSIILKQETSHNSGCKGHLHWSMCLVFLWYHFMVRLPTFASDGRLPVGHRRLAPADSCPLRWAKTV